MKVIVEFHCGECSRRVFSIAPDNVDPELDTVLDVEAETIARWQKIETDYQLMQDEIKRATWTLA